jgi:hypothetical protein
MRFVLEVEVGDEVAIEELGRIMRYWAGNLKHYALAPGVGEDVYDSTYAKVGRWHIAEPTVPAAEPATEPGQ